jgi:site-specific recombinase XerD
VIGASATGSDGDGWRLSVTASVEEVDVSGIGPFLPCLIHPSGRVPSLGEPLLDEYLRFTAARVRPNTLTAQAYDLKVFFALVGKPPQQVTVTDVLGFIEAQRAPRRGGNVVRLADGESGLAASTIKRRLATVSSLFDYLFLRGICDRNPVPRSLGARHARGSGAGRGARRGAPLVRAPRKLPRVLSPAEVVALTGALRTDRDRAMVALMVHGGLRRCEVLGLRFEHVQVGDRRVFVADGKGGHQRLVPVADVFFTALASYLAHERPKESVDDHVFVVLKGPHRGRPLTAAGLDEVLTGARGRAGLAHASCHELRHTCFTRLREAGMALEAIQAQAGHASIETTRIYLHLSNDWLAGEYQRAMAILDGLHEGNGEHHRRTR